MRKIKRFILGKLYTVKLHTVESTDSVECKTQGLNLAIFVVMFQRCYR